MAAKWLKDTVFYVILLLNGGITDGSKMVKGHSFL